MKAIIEVSLSQTQAAWEAINDFSYINSQLTQTASNVWETEEYDEDIEEEADAAEELICAIQEQFDRAGVTEYQINNI